MAENIMQCCYSNIVSENGTRGWNAFACSDNISEQIRQNYAKLQDINVTSQEPKDGDGNPLNMYEVIVDGEYLYLTRVLYGLQDARGRKNNMLSHSYLFPLQDVLKDANLFLTVEDSNFPGDVEAVSMIPQQLKRRSPYTMESALKESGIDQEVFVSLIYAMFFQKEVKQTIYIHSSQGEVIIRPLIYCIWNSIPLSMRRSFSFSSANVNNNANKTIVFSKNHFNTEYYFDLDTGENNIFEGGLEKKYIRWKFVDFFANNYQNVDGQLFFETLEEIAVKLGDSKATKMKVMRIAFRIMMNECEQMETLTEEELQDQLYEALQAPVTPTQYMDDYLGTILEQMNSRGFLLKYEQVKQSLLERLQDHVSPKLQQAGESYMSRMILNAPKEESIRSLSKLSGKTFERITNEMQERDNDRTERYLDAYYKSRIPDALTWESAERILDEISSRGWTIGKETKEKLEMGLQRLYAGQLRDNKDKKEVYEQYKKIGGKIYSTSAEDSPYEMRGKELYWDYFNMEFFTIKNREEYKFFFVYSNKKAECVHKLMGVFDALGIVHKQDCLQNLIDILKEYGTYIFTANICYKIKEELTAYMKEHHVPQTGWYRCWFTLILTGRNTVDFNEQYGNYIELLKNGNSREFVDRYLSNIRCFTGEMKTIKFRKIYGKCFILKMEDEECMELINIDVLLAIGETIWDNPFELLDNLDMFSGKLTSLVEDDAECVVSDSVLLLEDKYIDFAKAYLDKDTDYRSTVKSWISETKKQEKQKRRDEKGGEGMFGFMSKMRSKNSEEDDDRNSRTKKRNGLFGRK